MRITPRSTRPITCLFALALLCACGRDYDPNSVCRSNGTNTTLGWAPTLTVGLFDREGHPVCSEAVVTTRFQGQTRSLRRFNSVVSLRLVNGRLSQAHAAEVGCYDGYSDSALYWPCTDDVLEIEVTAPGCVPHTLRLTWWDNERLYGGLGGPYWNIPILLDCDASATTPPADASLGPLHDASADGAGLRPRVLPRRVDRAPRLPRLELLPLSRALGETATTPLARRGRGVARRWRFQ